MNQTDLAATPPTTSWDDLFVGPEPITYINPRVVARRGHPFLLLPCNGPQAAAVLDLYPAQTARARAVRGLLSWMHTLSLPISSHRISMAISPQGPFAKFMASLVGGAVSGVPAFGILAGNAATAGQRFLVLVFDQGQQPVAV